MEAMLGDEESEQLYSLWADFAGDDYDTGEIPPPEFVDWVMANQESYGFQFTPEQVQAFIDEKSGGQGQDLDQHPYDYPGDTGESHMKSFSTLAVEELAAELDTFADRVISDHPELRVSYDHGAVFTTVQHCIEKDQEKLSDGTPALNHATDISQLVLAKLQEQRAPSLIELVLAGENPDKLVDSLLQEDYAPFGIDDRVRHAGRAAISGHDFEGVTAQIAPGCLGKVVGVGPHDLDVLWDNGSSTSFGWLDAQNLLVRVPKGESNFDVVQLGNRVVMESHADWEVNGIDYVTKRVLLVDPKDAALYTFVPFAEIQEKIDQKAWVVE